MSHPTVADDLDEGIDDTDLQLSGNRTVASPEVTTGLDGKVRPARRRGPWADDELLDLLGRVEAVTRATLARSLRDRGHSLRAIAGALGVAKSTVADDLDEGIDDTDLQVSGNRTPASPEVTAGLDGKPYPARRRGPWADDELLDLLGRVEAVTRATLARSLRDRGHSLRAIGKLVSASKSTVENDLRELANSGQLNEPEMIAGTDGKDRPARRPEPVPDPDDHEETR